MAGELVFFRMLGEKYYFVAHLVSSGDREGALTFGQQDSFVEVLIVGTEKDGYAIDCRLQNVVETSFEGSTHVGESAVSIYLFQ